MKTLLLFTLLISGTVLAQTNVIAVKSHSSDISISNNEPDNFGGSMEVFEVYKVEYLGNECLVEMSKGGLNGWEAKSDTICNHPFLKQGKTDVKRIKKMYDEKVEFVGFDELEMDQGSINPEESNEVETVTRTKKKRNRKEKSSVLIFFLIGGGLFFTYLFAPKLNMSSPRYQH